jgi:Ala-tRNA(Pro) deacylase
MPIAPTLHRYLAAENIEYDEMPHVYTMTSARAAQACHVPGDRVAKAIVLRRNGGYFLAVLPASHHLRMADLRERFGEDVAMASENEVNVLFKDCAQGAVPAAGRCYGLEIIVDESIQKEPEIYMEAGDHETLLHMSRAQFARLTADAMHGRISMHD